MFDEFIEGIMASELLRPFKKEPEYKILSVTKVDNSSTTLTLKDSQFNSGAIKSYPYESRKYIYRPSNLVEYIGQDKAKELVKMNLKKIRELRPCHFLISGTRGRGKTALAYVIRNLLNATMIEHVASEIVNPEQIEELINKISYKGDEPRPLSEKVILFIDEIHGLKPNLCEILYPVMEDYKIGGQTIKPFILIGATTEKNRLMEKVAPMLDRFHVHIDLEAYTEEDIIKMLWQYHNQMYADKINIINDFKIKVIAQNCKFTPRIAITLLEDCYVEGNIGKILQAHRIVREGLTDIDFKLLSILRQTHKPVGENALAQMLGISQADYRTLYEPYLAEKGYILRTPRGRLISSDGERVLQ